MVVPAHKTSIFWTVLQSNTYLTADPKLHSEHRDHEIRIIAEKSHRSSEYCVHYAPVIYFRAE